MMYKESIDAFNARKGIPLLIKDNCDYVVQEKIIQGVLDLIITINSQMSPELGKDF